MAQTKVTDAMRNVTQVDAAKITTGTIPDARISASSVNAHVDLTAVRQDIAMLALYNAVSDNRAAYNLPYSFIDQFEDDTGITTETDVDRNASEYVSTYGTTTSLSGLLDFGVANFGAGASGSVGNGSWSGNDLTLSTLGELGITTEGASTPIVFPASSEFEYHFDPTGTTWGPYTLVCPTSYSGDNSCDPWKTASSTTWGQAGSMGVICGSTAVGSYGGGLKYNPSSGTAPARITSTNYNGTVCKIVRDSSNYLKFYSAGTLIYTSTSAHSDAYEVIIGPQGGSYSTVMNNLKYKWETTVATTPATGTLISDTQTSSVATTKMSGVILYKDNGSGASTLGTHLKIYLSANGGTNWTEVVAADYGAVTPLFSTGVKMVRLAEQTVTSGTTPVMKAVWASQASGTLETQLHGWAMNY